MLQNLKNEIDDIGSKKDYINIFKIIYKNDDKYFINEKGAFINLNTLTPATITDIKQYLNNIYKEPVIKIEDFKVAFNPFEEDEHKGLTRNQMKVLKKCPKKRIFRDIDIKHNFDLKI